LSELEALKQAIYDYDPDAAVEAAAAALGAGIDPLEALDAITEALTVIGEGFGCGDLFLPDLIGAANAAQTALPVLKEEMVVQGKVAKSLGVIVLGTVKGDIHDIGKSMVAALLIAHGFSVVDLGTDVATEDFVKAIEEHDADLLALSALLTTTAAQQKAVIEAVVAAGLRDRVKIMVGGGAVNADFAMSIGADGYGETAYEGVNQARELLGIKE
jgi:5-methyltetrahydrofolate--homocysteine methyltransferase